MNPLPLLILCVCYCFQPSSSSSFDKLSMSTTTSVSQKAPTASPRRHIIRTTPSSSRHCEPTEHSAQADDNDDDFSRPVIVHIPTTPPAAAAPVDLLMRNSPTHTRNNNAAASSNSSSSSCCCYFSAGSAAGSTTTTRRGRRFFGMLSFLATAVVISALLFLSLHLPAGTVLLLSSSSSSQSQRSKEQQQQQQEQLHYMFDVNGPPVALPKGQTILSITPTRRGGGNTWGEGSHYHHHQQQQQQQRESLFQHHSSKNQQQVAAGGGSGGGGGSLSLPSLISYSPSSSSSSSSTTTIMHAAEALICQQSIINYVINATDAKDECDGLTKAFDKACSDTHVETRQRRRRLRDKIIWWQQLPQQQPQQQQQSWQAWRYEWKVWFQQRIIRQLLLLLSSSLFLFSKNNNRSREETLAKTFFFAEDAIVGDAWEDACAAVEANLDQMIYRNVRQEVRQRATKLQQQEERQRRLLEQQQQQSSTASTSTNTTKTKPISLDLPKVASGSQSRANVAALDIIKGGTDIAAGTAAAAQESKTKSSETTEPNNNNNKQQQQQQLFETPHEEQPYDPNSPEARICCISILNVYQENCTIEPEEDVSDLRLFSVVCVMALCGIVKSLIRHFRILWLPEAAGCILVGVLSGYLLMLFPHHDFSFDGNWFLRILVPPIVFEAALGIDKRSFNRHIVPILLYAFLGTLIATVLTAFVVHRGSIMLNGLCPPIPFVEALTFGALISSIDPIAVLSVLSNMGMTDTDTIYVVIFGESLLNDGVAIVLFHTLVHFLDENLVIDSEALTDASIHFFVVAFGSLLIGVACGIVGTVYYWLFYQCQTALVEVLMFFCWALTPYYICDGIGWSGIVAAVATGFVMDLHIVGQKEGDAVMTHESETSVLENTIKDNRRARRPIFSPQGHLSDEAKTHINFVAALIATTMETAIFAYLGLFLFSHRYHWNIFHTFLAIFGCCASRGLMIPSLTMVSNWIARAQNLRATCQRSEGRSQSSSVFIDRRMQLALWFAGLRGAMSFALVEHIPMYDEETGEGTRVKPELKAMTSASILFTVFVLGGSTYYMMEHLGMAPSNMGKSSPVQEMVSLLRKVHDSEDENGAGDAEPRRNVIKNPGTFRARKNLLVAGY